MFSRYLVDIFVLRENKLKSMNGKETSSTKDDASEKNEKINKQKIIKILSVVFKPLIQKLSLDLVLNAKKQVDEIISRIKQGVLVGLLTLIGFLFLLIGSAFYVEYIFNFAPGEGFLIFGGVSILLGILIRLLKK